MAVPWDTSAHEPEQFSALGALIALHEDWFAGPGENEVHREGVLLVDCPFCGRMHSHLWDPANDSGHRELKRAHCCGRDYWVLLDPDAAHCVRPGRAIVRKVRPSEVPAG